MLGHFAVGPDAARLADVVGHCAASAASGAHTRAGLAAGGAAAQLGGSRLKDRQALVSKVGFLGLDLA